MLCTCLPGILPHTAGMDNHETARLSFLTMNWEKAPFGRSDYREFEVLPPKPKMFDEFKELYPEESYNSAKFSNFLIERCVLHPKMSSEDVENMPGGSYFYLLSQIRSKSYLNTEVSITKI